MWLTLTQVCEELGVSRSTLAEWRADGRFPAGKRLPNGSVRISRAALDRWLGGLVDA